MTPMRMIPRKMSQYPKCNGGGDVKSGGRYLRKKEAILYNLRHERLDSRLSSAIIQYRARTVARPLHGGLPSTIYPPQEGLGVYPKMRVVTESAMPCEKDWRVHEV
jgi:hypothetical protein